MLLCTAYQKDEGAWRPRQLEGPLIRAASEQDYLSHALLHRSSPYQPSESVQHMLTAQLILQKTLPAFFRHTHSRDILPSNLIMEA